MFSEDARKRAWVMALAGLLGGEGRGGRPDRGNVFGSRLDAFSV